MSPAKAFSILTAAAEYVGHDRLQFVDKGDGQYEVIDLDASSVMEQAVINPALLPSITVRADEINRAQARQEMPILSDRQFFHGLWKRNMITDDELLAAVSVGALPQAMLDVIDDPAFLAKLPALGLSKTEVLALLKGAKEFHYSHPVTPAIAEIFGWNENQFEAFWYQCSFL